ncbi:MAG: THUMP domain-containing protein [Bacteroidota bacterium]|nr:THUMP domain-containing protein [Bacteroidota bacterium]
MNQVERDFEIIGKTFSGMEGVLESELRALGAREIFPITRGIRFRGNQELLYKVNYECRSAIRFLKPILTFRVNDENDLYQNVKKFNWKQIFDINDTFSIDSVVSSSRIKHSRYAALKMKDAIVDQFREQTGKRPSIDVDNPTIRLHLHIHQGNCTISLDSSGSSLHLRGYRLKTVLAPINEVLAAGLIMLTGWNGQSNFLDLMCGSGTFLIEAAMIAKKMPPGFFRAQFGFQKWKDYDPGLWGNIKKMANDQVRELSITIMGSDHSDKAIRITRNNIGNAGLQKDIKLSINSIEDSTPPEGKGMIVINPPYGERLQPDDVNELYKTIGDSFKKAYSGYEAWIISSDLSALKFIGLRPSKKIIVFNGKLECRFARYELYEGSKKAKKQ